MTTKKFPHIRTLFTFCLLTLNTLADTPHHPPGQITPEPLKNTHFRYGLSLEVDGNEALSVVTLPESVYRHSERTDLGDIRVFNADGEIVPHTIREVSDHTTMSEQSVNLRFFPVTTSSESDVGNVKLTVRKGASGSLIEVSNDGVTKDSTSLVGYILDASALDAAIDGLTLDWTNSDPSFVQSVSVEASDDLTKWWSVVTNATIASFKQDNETLSRKDIEMHDTKAKYLRLSWSDPSRPLQLSRATVRTIKHATTVVSPMELRITGTVDTKNNRDFVFDAGGNFQTIQVEALLPQSNTLVKTSITSSNSLDGPWSTMFYGFLYRLTVNGREVSSEPIRMSRSDRYWKIHLEQAEGGFGGSIPTLKLSWRPHRLFFIVQGSGPFMLAYGNAHITDTGFVLTDLLSLTRQDEDEVTVARLSAERELSTPAKTPKKHGPNPVRKYILWGILGLGVIVLGALAGNLMRQMNKNNNLDHD